MEYNWRKRLCHLGLVLWPEKSSILAQKTEALWNIAQVARPFGSTDLIYIWYGSTVQDSPMFFQCLSMSFIVHLQLLLLLAFSGRAGTSGSCSVCFRTSACAWPNRSIASWDLRSWDKNRKNTATPLYTGRLDLLPNWNQRTFHTELESVEAVISNSCSNLYFLQHSMYIVSVRIVRYWF